MENENKQSISEALKMQARSAYLKSGLNNETAINIARDLESTLLRIARTSAEEANDRDKRYNETATNLAFLANPVYGLTVYMYKTNQICLDQFRAILIDLVISNRLSESDFKLLLNTQCYETIVEDVKNIDWDELDRRYKK